MRHPFLRTLAGSAATPTDPNFENVTLLLHGDGTNGGQNNTFVDGSTNNFTITRNGNTTQGTFSPYGDNWSNFFDGTGDYLTVPAGSSFAYGTGDFTVEGWFYATAEPVQYGSTLFSQTASGNNYFYLALGDDTANNPPARKIKFTFGSTNALSGSTTYNLHSWNHFALVRSSGSATVYLNGVGGTAVSCTTDFNNTTFVPTIGRYTHTNANLYTGYLSNFRVLKGTAQYTANFTPPSAPLTAITNTSLLTCQSNRFRDASTNNFTITRNGDVSVQRFSPFSPTAAYAAGTIGGSGYFDGTGDYLSIAGSTAFNSTGDFTMEAWIYLNARSAYGGIISFSDSSFANGGRIALLNTGYLEYAIGNVFYTSTLAPLAEWAHVAMVRSGSASNNVSCYFNGTRVGQFTSTAQVNRTSNVCVVGRYYADGTNQYWLNGYISDPRYVVGTAVYSGTTLTVPSAPLTAITNTQLLVNFQNAAILDNAMMAVPETVGNAQIDTTIKKFGTGSMKFDGTGDYLTVLNNPAFSFGTGDFTIECWVYIAGNSATDGNGNRTAGLFSAYAPSGVVSRGYTFEVEGNASTTGTGLSFYNNVSGSQTSVIATTTISQTTWHHVAVTRSGTTTRLFLNGTLIGSGTLGNQNVNSDYPAVVGRLGYASYLQELNGYIDDLRVTKGVARYTASFTPPTAAFPDL